MTIIMPESVTVNSISNTVEAKFARGLAANEKKIRDRAFKKLKQYMLARSLRSDGGFSREEMIRLWKGLFYCMWMSDKPLIQEELGRNMAKLLPMLHNIKSSMLYFEVFLKTISREWQGIDRLRMDKFYLLTRFMLHEALVCAKNNSWKDGVVDWLLSILKNGPFCCIAPTPSNSSGPPLGVRLHFIDIYLDELTSCGQDSLSSEQVTKFLLPYCVLVCNTPVASLRDQAIEKIFQEIIDQSDVVLEAVAEEGGEVELPSNRLEYDYSAIADTLFELASKKDAMKKNRDKVYKMVKKLREIAKGRLPVEDLPDFEDDDLNDESELEKAEGDLTEKLHEEMIKEFREEKARKKQYRKEKKKRKRDTDDEAFQHEDTGDSTENNEFPDDSNMELGDAEVETAPRKKKRRKTPKSKNVENQQSKTVLLGSALADDSMIDGTHEEDNGQKVNTTMDELLNESSSKTDELDVNRMMLDFVDELKQDAESSPSKQKRKKNSKKNKTSSIENTDKKANFSAVAISEEEFINGCSAESDNTSTKKRRKSSVNLLKRKEMKEKLKEKLAADVETVNLGSLKESSSQLESDVVSKKKAASKKNKPLDKVDLNQEHDHSFAQFTSSAPPAAAFVRVAASKLNKKQTKLKKPASLQHTKDEQVSRSASGKRVSFEMSKTQIQPFKKNEKSSVLSPSPLTIPFDPKKTPDFGLLKPRKTSIDKTQRSSKKKRPSASDFFD